VLLPKIKKKFPKIPTDGWLSQHQLGFLLCYGMGNIPTGTARGI